MHWNDIFLALKMLDVLQNILKNSSLGTIERYESILIDLKLSCCLCLPNGLYLNLYSPQRLNTVFSLTETDKTR